MELENRKVNYTAKSLWVIGVLSTVAMGMFFLLTQSEKFELFGTAFLPLFCLGYLDVFFRSQLGALEIKENTLYFYTFLFYRSKVLAADIKEVKYFAEDLIIVTNKKEYYLSKGGIAVTDFEEIKSVLLAAKDKSAIGS